MPDAASASTCSLKAVPHAVTGAGNRRDAAVHVKKQLPLIAFTRVGDAAISIKTELKALLRRYIYTCIVTVKAAGKPVMLSTGFTIIDLQCY